MAGWGVCGHVGGNDGSSPKFFPNGGTISEPGMKI